MNDSVRSVVSVVAGFALGLIVVTAGMAFSPHQPPEGVDYYNTVAYTQWIKGLPVDAFQVVLGVYLLASLTGGFVSGYIIPSRALWVGFCTGFAILFYGIVTFLAFPGPDWLTYTACVGCTALGLGGGWLGKRVSGK